MFFLSFWEEKDPCDFFYTDSTLGCSRTFLCMLKEQSIHTSGRHTFFRNLGVTSQFLTPEEQQGAGPILRTPKSGMTSEPHCYPMLSAWYI